MTQPYGETRASVCSHAVGGMLTMLRGMMTKNDDEPVIHRPGTAPVNESNSKIRRNVTRIKLVLEEKDYPAPASNRDD